MAESDVDHVNMEVEMLPELTSILPIIHALPTGAKQELLEILAKELEPAPPK